MHHLYLTNDVSFLKMGQCDSDLVKCFTWLKKKNVFLHLLFDVKVSFSLRCVYGDGPEFASSTFKIFTFVVDFGETT